MNYIYISEGQSVSYEDLSTGYLVVDGRIHVSGELTVGTIRGRGAVSAGQIYARDIRVDDLEAGGVYCDSLTAQRVEAMDVSAAKCVNAACHLSAQSVTAKRLAMTGGEIDGAVIGEIICLTPRRRSLFRFQLLAGLRSLWLKLTAPRARTTDVVDADYECMERAEQNIVHFESGKKDRPAA